MPATRQDERENRGTHVSRSTQADHRHFTGPSRYALGWGILLGWGVCFYFSDAFAGSVVSTRIGWITSSIVDTLCLACIAIARPQSWLTRQINAARSPLMVACTIVMALGTAIFGLSDSAPSAFRTCTVILLTMGSAGLTVCWGCLFAACDADAIERDSVDAIPIIALCYLLGVIAPPVLTVVFGALLPLVSLLAMPRMPRNRQHSREIVNNLAHVPSSVNEDRIFPLRQLVANGLGLLVSSCAIALLWTFERMSYGGAASSPSYTAAGICGIAVAAIVMLLYAQFSPHIDLAAFFRALCPIIVCGYLCASIRTPVGSLLAFGLAFLSQMLLDVMAWVWLTEVASRHANRRPRIIAAGRACQQAGHLCGFMISLALAPLLATSPQLLPTAELAVVAVLVAITMISVGGRDTASLEHVDERASDRDQASVSTDPASSGATFEERCAIVAARYALSARETEVLGYLARGHSLAYIRNELGISKSTVDTHARHIYRKCDVHAREELISLVEECTLNS